MNTTTVAVDLAKSVFELAVSDGQGRVIGCQAPVAGGVPQVLREPPALPRRHGGLRHGAPLGADVPRHGPRGEAAAAAACAALCAPQQDGPGRRGGAAGADRCGDILPVPAKSEDQQALQGLHRVRSGWMATRTARINMVRGLLREFGFDIPQGPSAVTGRVPGWLADEAVAIPPTLRKALSAVMDEIRGLEARIAEVEKRLRQEARQRPAVQKLMEVPGIGLLIATALVAAVGGMEAFRDGRHLAARLGLSPKEPAAASSASSAGQPSAATRTCAPCSSTARGRRSTPPWPGCTKARGRTGTGKSR